MECPKCGQAAPATARFCPACGGPLPSDEMLGPADVTMEFLAGLLERNGYEIRAYLDSASEEIDVAQAGWLRVSRVLAGNRDCFPFFAGVGRKKGVAHILIKFYVPLRGDVHAELNEANLSSFEVTFAGLDDEAVIGTFVVPVAAEVTEFDLVKLLELGIEDFHQAVVKSGLPHRME